MSLASMISTLNADKLMDAARKDLEPLANDAESKLHVEIAAALNTLVQLGVMFNNTLAHIADGYDVGIRFVDGEMKISITKQPVIIQSIQPLQGDKQ